MIRLSVLLFCLTSLLSSLVAQADDQAVVLLIKPSKSLSLSEGDKLKNNQQINLPIGTEMIVAFGNGETQSFVGPFKGKLKIPVYDDLDFATEKFIDELVEFVKENENTRGRETSDTAWSVVNVDTEVRYHCVAPSSHGVVLWRNQNTTASDVKITHKRTRKRVKLKWPANQETLKWPEKLPLHYGDTYTVKIKNRRGESRFKKLILYQLPDRLPTKSHKVVWMVGRGCIPQANILLASLR
jgi:hypothetical protein